MNEILDKVKKTIIALTPVVTAVGAVWGWDGAGIATATEAFLVAAIQYAQFWISYKNK